MHDNENATKKAIEIVNMNIAKTKRLSPVTSASVGVNHSALVVGGGIAGMNAALSLVAQGYGVHLVERQAELGGLLRDVRRNLEGDDVQAYLSGIIELVVSNPNITVHCDTTVEKVDGFVGNFITDLSDGSQVSHGALIVAIGGEEYTPTEYNFGQSDKIITQRTLEQRLEEQGPEDGKCYVMIQCVGSREEPNNYCSRICCQDALKNSIAIKEKAPNAQVVVLYRDMRAYGLKEDYYKRARDLGVLFFNYEVEEKPQVEITGERLKVRVMSKVLGREMLLEPDYLVLSTGLRPPEDVVDFSKKFKLTCNLDGFLLEAHVKLRPVDFPSEGFFLAGLAHAPKNLEETISQASAAAGRAGALLSKESLSVSGVISKHNRDLCMSCLACVKKCPFGAPFIDEDGRVSHNEVKCTGCGICAATCPAKAYQVNYFRDDQILAMVDSVTELK